MPPFPTLMRPAALLAIALGCIAPYAQAQDYRRIAPKEPAPNLPTVVPEPPPLQPEAPPPDADQVILPSLRGLVIRGTDRGYVNQPPGPGALVIENAALLDDPAIRDRLAAAIGKPLTLRVLQDLQRSIEIWYREHEHPFVFVYTAPQNVTAGVVEVTVSEYRVGQVRVTGNEWFSSDVLRREFGLKPGQTLDLLSLKQGLDFVNANPFREINTVLEKGPEPLTTDITLQTQDRFPVRVYVGYENNGQPITGHDRWNLGFNWGDAFGLGQQLSYQFTSSDDFWHHRPFDSNGVEREPGFFSHSVDWLAPLWNYDKLELFGFYAQSVPRLGPDLGQIGHSGQASVRYIKSLPPQTWLTHDLRLGYDFKTTDNNLEFGGVQVSANATEISQFPLIYMATATDDYGNTTVENTAVWSPGNMTPQNRDAPFQAQSGTSLVRAKYVYDRLSAVRVTQLPENMSWVAKLTTQFADHDLLVTEQLGAGGIDSVRGYDERTANGTQGVLVSQEIRSPPFSLFGALGQPEIGDVAQLHAFWDYGNVHFKGHPAAVPRGATLESTGVGLRYGLNRYLNVRLEFGFELRSPPGRTDHSQFGQLQITMAY